MCNGVANSINESNEERKVVVVMSNNINEKKK